MLLLESETIWHMLPILFSRLEVSNTSIPLLSLLLIAKVLEKCSLLPQLYLILTSQSAKWQLFKLTPRLQRAKLNLRKLLMLKHLKKSKRKKLKKRKQLKILLLAKNQRKVKKKRKRRKKNQKKVISLTLPQFHLKSKKLIIKKICSVKQLSLVLVVNLTLKPSL